MLLNKEADRTLLHSPINTQSLTEH